MVDIVVLPMGMQTPSALLVLSLTPPLGTPCLVQWLAESIHLFICQAQWQTYSTKTTTPNGVAKHIQIITFCYTYTVLCHVWFYFTVFKKKLILYYSFCRNSILLILAIYNVWPHVFSVCEWMFLPACMTVYQVSAVPTEGGVRLSRTRVAEGWSRHVGVGKSVQVLWKNSQYS